MENKKIAILTLPLHGNYGGNLQCYALCTVLQKMEYEVSVLNFEGKPKRWYKIPFSFCVRLIRTIAGKKIESFIHDRKMREDFILNQSAREFIATYIPLIKINSSEESLKKVNEIPFDAYIVGSDQVWRIPYAYPSIESYFLNFVRNDSAKRISYAASFGTESEEFSKPQIERCGRLIEKFDAVSVRESSGVDLINTYQWKCKPVVLLDPTMLLEQKDYIDLIRKRKTEKTNNHKLFYYVLDVTEDKQKLIDFVADELQLKSFTVNKSYSKKEKIENRLLPPVEDWLSAFLDAEFIVTDSFHGCVFSILFNKPFVVYGNEERGMARFKSILSLFNLTDRIVFRFEEYQQKQLSPINWDEITRILNNEREKSTAFLLSNLPFSAHHSI